MISVKAIIVFFRTIFIIIVGILPFGIAAEKPKMAIQFLIPRTADSTGYLGTVMSEYVAMKHRHNRYSLNASIHFMDSMSPDEILRVFCDDIVPYHVNTIVYIRRTDSSLESSSSDYIFNIAAQLGYPVIAWDPYYVGTLELVIVLMATVMPRSVRQFSSVLTSWVFVCLRYGRTEAGCPLSATSGTFDTFCSGDVNSTCDFTCGHGFEPRYPQQLSCLISGNWSKDPGVLCPPKEHCYTAHHGISTTTIVITTLACTVVVTAVACVVHTFIRRRRIRERRIERRLRHIIFSIENASTRNDDPPTYSVAMRTSLPSRGSSSRQQNSLVAGNTTSQSLPHEDPPPAYEEIDHIQKISLRGFSHV
ncbi:hypothetical protein ScPMuIL_003751 [Solemya velum]